MTTAPKAHSLHVTFFPDAFARTLKAESLTLPALRDLIYTTSARSKAHLRLLKLARFGNETTAKNCLRHNDNVRAIFGVETDYDGEQISFDAAVATIRKAHLCALVYTSPSHTVDRPRWRLLLPTSDSWSPAMRRQLVARVNGLFGGALGRESFTLSQAYYFGRVNGNPLHQCELIDGDFINLRWDLDAGAIFPNGNDSGERQPNEDKEAEIERVIAALAVISNDDNDDKADRHFWIRVGHAVFAATNGSDDGFAAFDAWSKRHQTYDERYTADRWKTFKPKRIGAGTLFHLAEQAWPGWEDDPQASPTIRKFADAIWGKQQPVDTRPPRNAQPSQRAHAERKVEPAQSTQAGAAGIKATPFIWIDPAKIPPRQWLYKPHCIRQFISATISPGGIGKSSLLMAEALAMVVNKPLLGIQPSQLLRVWYWNGEDPMDELHRRFAAAIKHYRLMPDDIGDRLFIDSGRTLPIVIAEDTKTGTRIATPVVNDLIAELRNQRIDILVIDPFVSCHRVTENDNNAIECVAKSWSHIAEAANCSIHLAHHSRKTGGENVTVEDGRGATALRDAVRFARTLNTMTTAEAENADINEAERRLHFRSDIGKANLTRPAEQADWFKLASVDLSNNKDGFGDNIGVVTSWDYPMVDEPVVDVDVLTEVKDAIRNGGPWRSDQKATSEPWVGTPIAKVLGLNLQSKLDKRAVAKLIKGWLAAGVLVQVDHQGRGADRHIHKYLEVAPEVAAAAKRKDDEPHY